MTWTLLHDTDFTSTANTAAVGAGQTLTDGWADVQGNVWSVASARLVGTGEGTNSYFRDFLVRPSGESYNLQMEAIGFDWSDQASGSLNLALRYQSGSKSCYFFVLNFSTKTLECYSDSSGASLGTIVSPGTVTFSPTAGHEYTLVATVTGASPTTIGATLYDTTGASFDPANPGSTPVVCSFSAKTDSTSGLQATGQYGLNVGNTTAVKAKRVRTYYGVTPAYTAAAPSAWPASRALTVSYAAAVTLASALVVTPSDSGAGGSFSPTTVTLPSGTGGTGSITYTPSSSPASLTLSSTNNGGLTDPSPLALTTFAATAVNDPNLFASPYNFYVGGSAYAQANNPGAYLKTTFGGTSCKLLADPSLLSAGGISPSAVTIRWSIDNGPTQTSQVPAAQTELTLASGLSSGSHTLRLEFVLTTSSGDRWTPYNVLRLLWLHLDPGALLSAPTLYAGRMLVFGDSITEGVNATGSSNDAGLDWCQYVANALACEYGQVGFGGQGWTITGGGNVVPLYTPSNDSQTAWNKIWSGLSRLSGGLLSPAPDYLLNNHGANDGLHSATDAAVTASVQGWLTAARAAAPNAKIALVLPFGQYKKSAILAGFNAWGGGSTSTSFGADGTVYKAAGDSKAAAVDCGAILSGGLTNSGASQQAGDGIHPNPRTHALIGAQVVRGLDAAFAVAAGSGSGFGMNGGFSL